jgi:hypothetical protein
MGEASNAYIGWLEKEKEKDRKRGLDVERKITFKWAWDYSFFETLWIALYFSLEYDNMNEVTNPNNAESHSPFLIY